MYLQNGKNQSPKHTKALALFPGKAEWYALNELERRRRTRPDKPYLAGESWWQAVQRVRRFLDDLHPRWEGLRDLVIGHVATCWGMEDYLNGVPLEDLIPDGFNWRPGWDYLMP